MTGARNDTGFERARAAAARRSWRWRWRAYLALSISGAVVVAFWWAPVQPFRDASFWLSAPPGTSPVALGTLARPVAPSAQMQSNAPAAMPDGLTPEAQTAFGGGFLDLPGDPLWIERSLDTKVAVTIRQHERPEGLAADRGAEAILHGVDLLLRPGERLAVNLPSSQEDFAVFQAQRRVRQERAARPAAALDASAAVGGPLPPGPPEPADSAAARALHDLWQAQPTGADRHVTFLVRPLVPSSHRHRHYADNLIRVNATTGFEALLLAEGISPEMTLATAAAAADLGISVLDDQQIVALRRPVPLPRHGLDLGIGRTAAEAAGGLWQVAIYEGGASWVRLRSVILP